jgi:hypothetical protein
MADFRTAYSNLIQAFWRASTPEAYKELEESIKADPSKLQEYGFDTVPQAVSFSRADKELANEDYTKGISKDYKDDYDRQRTSWNENKTGSVTFFIPLPPSVSGGMGPGAAQKDASYCCCCCPCCTCT